MNLHTFLKIRKILNLRAIDYVTLLHPPPKNSSLASFVITACKKLKRIKLRWAQMLSLSHQVTRKRPPG